MTAKKKIRDTGKTLLQLSLKDDDDLDPERVKSVLKGLDAHPPRHYKAVLREYHRLVRKQVDRNQAVVEYAGALPDDLLNSIEASLSAQYARPITAILKENKDLIAGWRIRIASDVYDSSIQNHLHQLAKSTSH